MKIKNNPVEHLTKYDLHHLIEHLTASRRSEDLHRLLNLETDEQHNAWYEARIAFGDITGFLGDIEKAWRLAQSERLIPEQIKYALYRTSIVALSNNVPPSVISQAMEIGIITPRQALVEVSQNQEDEQKSKALVKLAPHLSSPDLLRDAMAIASQIENEHYRLEAVGALFPYLSKPLQLEIVDELLRDVLSNSNSASFVHEKLRILAPLLSESLLINAFQMTRQIEDDLQRSRAIRVLIPHLPSQIQLMASKEAIDSLARHHEETRGMFHSYAVARDWGELAEFLPAPYQGEILTLAWDIVRKSLSKRPEIWYVKSTDEVELLEGESDSTNTKIYVDIDFSMALEVIAPFMPDHLREEAIKLAWYAIRRRKGNEGLNEKRRAKALLQIAPYMTAKLLKEAENDIRQIRANDLQAETLGELAFLLPEPQKEAIIHEAWKLVRHIGDLDLQFKTLELLTLDLSDHLRKELIDISHQIEDKETLSEVLGKLAPFLPEPLRERVLIKSLEAARQTILDSIRVRLISQLIPNLTEPLYTEALEEAWQESLEFKNNWILAVSFRDLIPYLPEPLLVESLSIAKQIKDNGTRAQILGSLAEYLTEPLRSEALKDALIATLDIGHEWPDYAELNDFVINLPESSREIVLQVAEQRHQNKVTSDSFTNLLASSLPDSNRNIFKENFQQDKLELGISFALHGLAPHLTEKLLTTALQATPKFKKEEMRASAIKALAPYLPDHQLKEALRFTLMMHSQKTRAETLVKLVQYFPDPLLKEFLQVTLQSEDIEIRTRIWGALTEPLSEWIEEESESIYNDWEEAIHRLSNRPRQDFLIDMKYLLPLSLAIEIKKNRSKIAADIFQIFKDVGRWWP